MNAERRILEPERRAARPGRSSLVLHSFSLILVLAAHHGVETHAGVVVEPLEVLD